MDDDLKILIVGAGPTGLTAALEFIKHGIKVDIVEKRSAPSTLSRAVGLMPESLLKLGESISQKILAESMPFYKINMHVGVKRVLSLDLVGKVKPEEVLTGLPQNRTEEIMRDELKVHGVVVKYNCAVTSISTKDESSMVNFNDLPTVNQYDWVIACDGTNSTVRKQLEIDYSGYELDGKWSIADVDLEDMKDFSANNVWMKMGANYDAVISLPIGKNRVRIISTSEDCLGILPVKLKIKKINRDGVFRISVRQASTYKKGRVLLAGDAAHCHSPVGGKGMNLGIADAVDAARAIMNNTTDDYTAKRHEIGARVIKESESFRKMIKSKNPFLKMFITFMFRIVNKSKWLQSFAVKRMSQL